MKKNIKFISQTLKLEGVLSVPGGSIEVGVLFLHGGGHANAERYRDVQNFLSRHGINSFAFSFRGCGKSEGLMSNSTLLDRLSDAENALAIFKQTTGLSESQVYIWGSSMGGHIACRLIATHPQIRGLILQSAAAYGQIAEFQAFGPKFSEIINKEFNWDNSYAFTGLASYQNKTLILYGESDNVIPNQVKQRYLSSAGRPDYHVIPGYGHPMLRPITEIEKRAWDTMVNLALNFILKVT